MNSNKALKFAWVSSVTSENEICCERDDDKNKDRDANNPERVWYVCFLMECVRKRENQNYHRMFLTATRTGIFESPVRLTKRTGLCIKRSDLLANFYFQ